MNKSINLILKQRVTDSIQYSYISLVLGLDCNCHCSYCYQDIIKEKSSKLLRKKDLNRIVKYIRKQYKKNPYTAITFFGGEPLLYMDDIQYLLVQLSDTPLYKRIFTNGFLLNQDIVNLFNKNHVAVFISNDGPDSYNTRGYDILRDYKKVRLLNQIQDLTTSSVVYAGNEDIMAPLMYFKRYLLHNTESIFTPMQVYQKTQKYTKEFNWDLYKSSVLESYKKGYQVNYIFNGYRSGFATFIDGSIINLNTNTLVGQIDENGDRIDFDVADELREKSGCLFEQCPWFKTPFCAYKVYQIEDNTFCRKVAEVHKEIYNAI